MNKMDYEERKTIYRIALNIWGANAQTRIAIEEMAELTKEICKLLRGEVNMENLADEIADVIITLEQLCLIYNLRDKVCEHMDKKIVRLQTRLEGEHHED